MRPILGGSSDTLIVPAHWPLVPRTAVSWLPEEKNLPSAKMSHSEGAEAFTKGRLPGETSKDRQTETLVLLSPHTVWQRSQVAAAKQRAEVDKLKQKLAEKAGADRYLKQPPEKELPILLTVGLILIAEDCGSLELPVSLESSRTDPHPSAFRASIPSPALAT